MERKGTGRRQVSHAQENRQNSISSGQENTRTVVCNIYVMNVASYCELKPSPNRDRTWVLVAYDCSDGLPGPVQLALTFASTQVAVKLGEVYHDAQEVRWPEEPTLSG